MTSKFPSPSTRGGGRGHYFRNRGSYRGTRGRGRQNDRYTSSAPRPTCQVCQKPGHIALNCYHRFNQAFQSAPPPSFLANSTAYTTASYPSSESSTHSDSTWYPDTAATHHFTNNFSNLSLQSSEYKGDDQVRIGDGTSLPIQHSGSSTLPTSSGNYFLSSLYHVPLLSKNLIFVRQICTDNSVFFEFHSSCFFVKDSRTQKTLLQGPIKDGMYVFPPPPVSPQAHSTARISPQQWHLRLGHPSQNTLRQILSDSCLPATSVPFHHPCPSCCQAKLHQLPYQSSTVRSTAPLQLLYADVWGPSPTLSRLGSRYYLAIVDDYSRYTWFFPLTCKSEVSSVFLRFKKNVELTLNHKILAIQTDGGGEFRSLHNVLLTFGISHRLSCPYAHPQNGSVERKHRHIVETGLALLSHCSAPHRFWTDAFSTAVYLINRLPTPVLHQQSPFTVLFSKPPDYLFLKTFGCLCWPNLRPYNKHKIDYRSLPCVFLGYSPSHHGYICYHIPTSRVYISRDVLFDELHFPFATTSTAASLPSPPSPPYTFSTIPTIPLPDSTNSTSSNIPLPDPSPLTPFSPDLSSTPTSSSPLAQNNATLSHHPMHTRSKSSLTFPKVFRDGTVPWPPRASVTTLPTPPEPTSYTEASKHAD